MSLADFFLHALSPPKLFLLELFSISCSFLPAFTERIHCPSISPKLEGRISTARNTMFLQAGIYLNNNNLALDAADHIWIYLVEAILEWLAI